MEIKLRKKDKAILDTLKRPYSREELVSRIGEIPQNLLKYIYEDIKSGAEYVEEMIDLEIPAENVDEQTIIMDMAKVLPNQMVINKVHRPGYTTKHHTRSLEMLRFNHGSAMVGMEVSQPYSKGIELEIEHHLYIHKPFWDRFKDDKKIALEQYWYRNGKFNEDDFPRVRLHELTEVGREGDWVICKY